MASNATVAEVTETLAATSDAGLLATFAALTHQVHEAEREARTALADVRAQRDLVQTEILGRMAAGR